MSESKKPDTKIIFGSKEDIEKRTQKIKKKRKGFTISVSGVSLILYRG